MKKLISLAEAKGYQAEAYSKSSEVTAVSYQNGSLQDIESSFHTGISLRILKDGISGYAYTKNLLDREQLLGNAIDSLAGGVDAPYQFPLTDADSLADATPTTQSFEPTLASLTSSGMVDECVRINQSLNSTINGETMVNTYKSITEIRIVNTSGTDLATKSSVFSCNCSSIYPGSATGISRSAKWNKFNQMPENLLTEVTDLYRAGEEVVEPVGGKMKVLFMPRSMGTFIFRIQNGMSAKSLYEKVTPLAKRLGEQIWSSKLTLIDSPADSRFPEPRAFDDEGVPSQAFTLVEDGVFKNFFTDLHYAAKLGLNPTGQGFRTSMWGGDATTLAPSPVVSQLIIKPGADSFAKMVAKIDRGIILEGVLGPHSGNIPNGDYSVGVCPGFYVEDGRIIGRIKDVMVAGNIYETLQNVTAVGNKLYPSGGGYFPAILCENVSVAGSR